MKQAILYNKLSKKSISIIFCLILFMPMFSMAAEFNQNNIISDEDLTNSNAMSLKRITNFLNSHGGFLSSYISLDVDGEMRSAAEIIYNASQTFILSPKFILTTLQKESSIVTATSTSQHLIDFALGFGCSDGSQCSDKYQGFAKQVNAAANNIRNGYLADLDTKNSTISGWGVGVAKQAYDGVVTPRNKATAVLYTYTPWIGYYSGNTNNGGNSLFWDIWQDWFGSSDVYIYYPSGSLLQSKESGIIYLINNDKKMAFTSIGALMANYDINKTIAVGEDVLDQYKEGNPILFPNYTLLQAPNGAIFLYVNGKKRGIPSQEIFHNLGYNPEEIIPMTNKEASNIPNGEIISELNAYPLGILLQNKQTGAIVYVDENNKRHDIWSKKILETRFKGMPIFQRDEKEISQYKKSTPTTFNDGELLSSKNSSAVYLIKDGKKEPFASAKVFKKLGYKWDNIIYTTDQILNLYPTGKKISLKK